MSKKKVVPKTWHRGAFCKFIFPVDLYCRSSKLTGKEADKMHLCALSEVDKKYHSLQMTQSIKTNK